MVIVKDKSTIHINYVMHINMFINFYDFVGIYRDWDIMNPFFRFYSLDIPCVPKPPPPNYYF